MLLVLRLGHRKGRDPRLSTHVGLTARALGADGIIYSGEEDSGLLESIGKVAKKWGGPFKVEYVEKWERKLRVLKRKGFCIVHLTMYGLPVEKEISGIRACYRKCRKLVIVVGSEKVPREMYELADWNVSVTSQPHSEVAALAVFLHEFLQGKELDKKFTKSQVKITPQARGKRVERRP